MTTTGTRRFFSAMLATTVAGATIGIGAVLLAPAAQAAVVTAVTGVTVTPAAPSLYTPVSVKMTWCAPATSTPGDTFSLALPSQLRALSTGFPLKDPTGATVANATFANNVATFTLTSYVSTHNHVCGTAFFNESLNASDVTIGTPTPLSFGSGGRSYTTVVTPQLHIGFVRTKALKYGSWASPSTQDSVSPTDALDWMMDSPQAPATGFTKVVFTDTASAGQAFDCARISLSVGGINALGNFVAHSTVAKSHYVQACSPSALTLTSSIPVASGTLLHLFIPTSVTNSSLSSYGDSGTVAVNGEAPETAAAQAIQRLSAGGDGAGLLNVTKPVTTKPVTTKPVTTKPVTTGPVTTAPVTTAPVTTKPASGMTESSVSRTPTAGIAGVATKLPAGGLLAATGSPTAGLLEIGLVALLLGAGAQLVGRRRTASGSAEIN
jgi:hypothetical protein